MVFNDSFIFIRWYPTCFYPILSQITAFLWRDWFDLFDTDFYTYILLFFLYLMHFGGMGFPPLNFSLATILLIFFIHIYLFFSSFPCVTYIYIIFYIFTNPVHSLAGSFLLSWWPTIYVGFFVHILFYSILLFTFKMCILRGYEQEQSIDSYINMCWSIYSSIYIYVCYVYVVFCIYYVFSSLSVISSHDYLLFSYSLLVDLYAESYSSYTKSHWTSSTS